MIEITPNETQRLIRRGIVRYFVIKKLTGIRVSIVIGSEAGHTLNNSYPTIDAAKRAIDELGWSGPIFID